MTTNKSRDEIGKCPKMVLQITRQNSLILQVKNYAASPTEKAYFAGRLLL
jgi:hypothetical protein